MEDNLFSHGFIYLYTKINGAFHVVVFGAFIMLGHVASAQYHQTGIGTKIEHIEGTITGLVDLGDEIIVGTYSSLWKLAVDRKIKNISKSSESGAVALCKDIDDTLWACIVDTIPRRGRIHKLNDRQSDTLYFVDMSIRVLAPGENGYLWAGTEEELKKISIKPNNNLYFSPPILFKGSPIREVYAIYIDDKGLTWVATKNGLFVIYEDNIKQIFNPESGVRAICESPSGLIWVAGNERIYGFNAKRIVNPNTKSLSYDISLDSTISTNTRDVIRDIKFDSKGNIWFASNLIGCVNVRSGLVYYFKNPDSEESFLFNKILLRDNCILAGTVNKGLYWFAIEQETTPTDSISHYNSDDIELIKYDTTGIPTALGQKTIKKSKNPPIEIRFDEVTIKVSDYQQEDGDIISLYLNGVKILSDYPLTKAEKVITLRLKQGDNFLLLESISEGDIPITTISLQIASPAYTTKLSSNIKELDIINLHYMK